MFDGETFRYLTTLECWLKLDIRICMDDSSLYAFIRLYLTFQSVACHFSFAPFGFTFIFSRSHDMRIASSDTTCISLHPADPKSCMEATPGIFIDYQFSNC